MPRLFYRKTKKVLDGWRELEDFERVKPGDIIWSCTSRILRFHTYHPNTLLSGRAAYLVVNGAILGKKLTGIRACEIVDLLAGIWGPELGENLKKRKYSLWRQRMKLEPRPEPKALPLP